MSKLSGWKMMCLTVAGVTLSLLAANVVGADSFSDQAAKLDIVGVHLGMTPAQAQSVLAQHRKGMLWQEEKGNLGIQEDQFLARANAVWGNVGNSGAERVVVVFSPPPGGPKVVAVSRDVSFDKSQVPTVENLANSLTDKFGQPGYKSTPSPGPIMVWYWDKAGQTSRGIPLYLCDVTGVYNELQNPVASIPGFQQDNDAGCAIAVRAQINSLDSGIANQLFVTLIDVHDALQAAIAADNHVKQANEAKKQEELKKASANKSSL